MNIYLNDIVSEVTTTIILEGQIKKYHLVKKIDEKI
jgi:hypothetical protein